MSTRKIRLFENFILITFPVVLFAGCAGSDVKPVAGEQTQTSFSHLQELEYTNPQPATEIPTISVVDTEDSNVTDNQPKLGNNADSTNSLSSNQSFNDSSELNNTEPLTDVNIPDKRIFYFNTNIHTLTEVQREELQVHADFLIANPGSLLVINGHADERGSENYNQTLSEKRATETYNFLINQGVPDDQLISKGYGELVPMHAENNWDENRRIELEYTDPMMLSSM